MPKLFTDKIAKQVVGKKSILNRITDQWSLRHKEVD